MKLNTFLSLGRVVVILYIVLGFSYFNHFFPGTTHAATGINKKINFQGKVVNSNGTNVADGSYSFNFKLYTAASGGTAIWSETQTLTVTAGIFRAALGSQTNLPGNVDFNTDNIYLGIEFNSDGEMTPRIQFAAVPYAFNAEQLNGLTAATNSGTITVKPYAPGALNLTTFGNGNGLTLATSLGTAGNSGSITIQSGATVTSGNSGGITIDSGAAVGTAGTISIGTTNATGITLGRSGLTSITSNSGLSFSSVTTDITTGTNEDFTLSPNGSGNIILTSTYQSGVKIGSSSLPPSVLAISGGIGNNAAAIINQANNGDILAASASGITKFVIKNDGTASSAAGFTVDAAGAVQSTKNQSLTIGGNSTGNININPTDGSGRLNLNLASSNGLFINNTAGAALTSTNSCVTDIVNGIVTGTAACTGGVGTNYWQLNNGAISPFSNTLDVLVGATSTTSAKFAVLNVNSGTPTASVSSGLNGNGMYITADGTLSTTKRTNLTLGNSSSYDTSGNINIHPNGTGNVGIGTTNSSVAKLEILGNEYLNGNIGIGTTTLSSRINLPISTTATDGINFGADTNLYRSAANTLQTDDELWSTNKIVLDTTGASTIDINTSSGSSVESMRFLYNDVVKHQFGNYTGNMDFFIDSYNSSAVKKTSLSINADTLLYNIDPNAEGWKMTFGTDTNLYRSAANVLSTDDSASIAANLSFSGASTAHTLKILDNGTLNIQRSPGGDAGATSLLYIQNNGNIGIGNNTSPAATVDITGSLKASSTITFSNFNANNNILYATVSTGVLGSASTDTPSQCLISGASAPSWGSCGGGSNYWNITGGAISPIYASTLDFLLGSQATTSAKFAVLNVNNGTPVASVSSGLNGNGMYFTADGTLATTNRNSLVLGNSTSYNTTGDILIHPSGVGQVGIGTTNLLGQLNISRPLTAGVTGKALAIFDQYESQDLITASQAGTTRFRVAQTGAVTASGTTLAAINLVNSASFDTLYTVQNADATWKFGISTLFTNGSGFVFRYNNNTNMTIDPGGYVGIGSNANYNGSSLLKISGTTTGDGALIVDQRTANAEIFAASASGTKKFVIDYSGNVGIGTNGSGITEKLHVNGNIRIDQQTNTVTAFSKITQTQPGKIAGNGSTELIASISASTAYNGSVYVGTARGPVGGAEIYRYNGSSGNWTLVSQSTPGTIASGGTANIASVSAMIVYSGKLFVGTSKVNGAEVYRYDGGSTWTKVTNPTAGTIGATTAIDGVISMIVMNGKLFIGTEEVPGAAAGGAQVFRYEGGSTWTAINTTAGQFAANITKIPAVTAMTTFNNSLVIGVRRGTQAGVYKWNGDVPGASVFTLISGTVGTPCTSGAATTPEISALTVYNGNLYLGTTNLTNGGNAEVCMYAYRGNLDQNAALPTAWTRVISAAGTMVSGGTSTIGGIRALTVYNGRLYAATEKINAAEVYQLIDDGPTGGVGGMWTAITPSAGTLVNGGTSSIDKVNTLVAYNNVLYAGTGENAPTGANGAEVYTYQNITDQSYALKFHAGSLWGAAGAGGGGATEQTGLPSDGSIYYMASVSGNMRSNGQNGSFIFSSGIITSSGAYDVAEDYPTRDTSLEPGDIVSVEPSEAGFVRKADNKYPETLGIYSENPGLRLSQTDQKINGGDVIPVALVGRVPVKVSLEGGEIKPGDYLTLSAVPGVAKKATKAGRIIGKTLEGYSGEGIGKILVFVTVASYNGDSLITQIPNISRKYGITDDIANIYLSLVNAENVTLDENKSLSEVITDRVAAGLEIITPTLYTQKHIAKIISSFESEDLKITLNDGNNLVVSGKDSSGAAALVLDVDGNAIFNGTVFAKKIKAEQLEIPADALMQVLKTNGLDIVSLKSAFQYATESALLVSSLNQNNSDFSQKEKVNAADIEDLDEVVSKLMEKDIKGISTSSSELTVIKDGLVVYGASTVNEMSVMNSLSIATNFILGNKSINVFGSDLDLQPLRQGGISFLGGIMKMSVDGEIKILGNTIFDNKVIFNQIAEFASGVTFKGKVTLEKTPIVGSDTTGSIQIKKGQDRAEVFFKEEYLATPSVNLTLDIQSVQLQDGSPEDQSITEERILKAGYSYVVSRKSTKGFSIVLNKKAEEDITFSWTAFGSSHASSSSSAGLSLLDNLQNPPQNSHDRKEVNGP